MSIVPTALQLLRTKSIIWYVYRNSLESLFRDPIYTNMFFTLHHPPLKWLVLKGLPLDQLYATVGKQFRLSL